MSQKRCSMLQYASLVIAYAFLGRHASDSLVPPRYDPDKLAGEGFFLSPVQRTYMARHQVAGPALKRQRSSYLQSYPKQTLPAPTLPLQWLACAYTTGFCILGDVLYLRKCVRG